SSISILAMAHIFISIPCLYFAMITDWKKMPKSAWGLLAFTLVLILSVFINIEIMEHGWKPALKAKYFVFGFLSISPFFYFIKNKLTYNRKKVLVCLILASSLVALIAGTIGKSTGFNPVTMRAVSTDRNAGLMGMVLNYAHNLSYFMTIFAVVLIAFWKDISRKERVIFCAILALNIFALYTTYTRGAILAFVGGIAGYYLKDIKKLIITIVTLGLIGGVAYF